MPSEPQEEVVDVLSRYLPGEANCNVSKVRAIGPWVLDSGTRSATARYSAITINRGYEDQLEVSCNTVLAL